MFPDMTAAPAPLLLRLQLLQCLAQRREAGREVRRETLEGGAGMVESRLLRDAVATAPQRLVRGVHALGNQVDTELSGEADLGT